MTRSPTARAVPSACPVAGDDPKAIALAEGSSGGSGSALPPEIEHEAPRHVVQLGSDLHVAGAELRPVRLDLAHHGVGIPQHAGGGRPDGPFCAYGSGP